MSADHDIHRLCGLRGCIESVTPGAFAEFYALGVDGRFRTVRVEVCEPHFDAAQRLSSSNRRAAAASAFRR